MALESWTHDDNCFVTLTYNEDHIPKSNSVDPDETRKWLYRLRQAHPGKFRYFLVGEYGDQSQRPHYHACLFGVSMFASALIEKTWAKGFVQVAEFNPATAAYVAKYVIKRMTQRDDPRLAGRHPEFARMSNRPGLGAPAMEILANQLHSTAGLNEIEKMGDVPHQLRVGKQLIPIGRYLRSRLRKEMGMPDEWLQRSKQAALMEKGLETLALWQLPTRDAKTLSYSQALVNSWQGKIWSAEGRAKINDQRQRKPL